MNQKQIFELIEKFEESSLSELKVETEGFKIKLKNASAVPTVTAVPPAAYQQPITEAPAETAEAAVSEVSGNNEIITSPIVGSFYRAPATDAPPFIEEGSQVQAGDSICIIEAMKIMNKLEAEFPCEIVKILAENGQMVEYGAPLFEVRRK
ncbi:MAG: acetyl-CoA carboxylase biotin carboxyl carrier protein [Spirochaetes bacterium]|nr:MAG: acetyl-CoA carboxylase biotin carboxyl carrier protein [Spirochaetota bacterium]